MSRAATHELSMREWLFQTGERGNSYETFLDDLQVKDGDNDDCRYAVYDYDYVQEAEGTEASYRCDYTNF